MKWFGALGAAMFVTACAPPEAKIIDNAERALEAANRSENYVRVGTLFGRDNGVFCIVLGELDEVHFADAVPSAVRGEVVRQIGTTSHSHMTVAAHVFNNEGRPVSTWSLHRRNPRLYIDTPDGQPDMDVCFGPHDRVLVESRPPPSPMAIIYSLETNAHD